MVNSVIPHLDLKRFCFEARFLEKGKVTRELGVTLRGGFGSALRQVSCTLGLENCRECSLGTACAYGYIFETPVPPGSEIMRKYPHAPHPFIFAPGKRILSHVEKDQVLTGSIVVIGGAIRYLPYFFLALEHLGRLGLGQEKIPFKLESVETEEGTNVYRRSDGSRFKEVRADRYPLEPGEKRESRFNIRFESPVRIQRNGEILAAPTLVDIVKTLARRIQLLGYFHCGGWKENVSSAFLSAADNTRCTRSSWSWLDSRRFSSRQGRPTPTGGAIGDCTFEGDIGTLEPLLRIGEYVHVGKGTSFGLGKYILLEEK